MVSKDFREPKYQNQTGSKTGNWYLNRIDYFQFHQYPAYGKHKLFSLLAGVALYFIGMKVLESTFWGSLPVFYLSYLSLLSFNILRRRICRYKGYFLYPTRFVRFFRAYEIEVDVEDFDSIATMDKK